MDERRDRFCLALVSELERRGYSVTPRTSGFDVRFSAAELVEIDVLHRSIWTPTPSAKRGRKAASPPSQLPAQQEGVPTGPLKFTAKAYRQQKRRWSEVKGAFAGRIDEIVDALEAMAASAAAVRQEGGRWDRQWRDAEERYIRRLLHQRAKAACREGLRQLASDWEEAEKMRRFLAAASQRLAGVKNAPKEAVEWITWGRARAEALDPLSGEMHRFTKLFEGVELELIEEELTEEQREFDREFAEAEQELPPMCRVEALKLPSR